MTQLNITLEDLLSTDSDLSSLPEIYIKVSETLDDTYSTSAQIGSIVETDPALSARILKMVNSSFYGFPSKISTISQAINILGRARLRQILIGSMLGGVFSKVDNRILDLNQFWYSSIRTAILSLYICKETEHSQQADKLFTAGLLHKIGRLIIAQQLPQQAVLIQRSIKINGTTLLESEANILGFTHNEVGASYIERWGMPKALAEICRHYINPMTAGELSIDASIVNLASNLAELPSDDDYENMQALFSDLSCSDKLNLSHHQLIVACRKADEQVQEVLESLGMVS